MKHIFDVEFATKVGINCAIILENLAYWCKKNKANNKHFYEGSTWTYNSVEAFSELHPYMTSYSIRKALEDLEKFGYIIVGNFNKANYDRTKWYSVTEIGFCEIDKCIYRNQQMDFAKTENGFCEIDKPIPNIKSNIKSNKKEKIIGNVPAEQLPNESEISSSKDLKKQTLQRKAKKVLTRLNELSSKPRGFRLVETNLKHIIARLDEGFSIMDCFHVLETKIHDPYFKENPGFYNPETLFRPKNFEKYLNQDVKEFKKQSKGPSNGSGLSGKIEYKKGSTIKVNY